MALRFSEGGYVAQVFAYENDTLRLLRDAQLHVAAGNALYAAVFLCRYSAQPSVIEKRAVSRASTLHSNLDQDQRIDSVSPGGHSLPSGDLTLTLIHVDTTWRFDSFDSRRASPNLSWPAIRKFFTPGAFVEGDLILRDQYCHHDALRTLPPAAHLLHIEIGCGWQNDAAVESIAQRLRSDVQYWTRQLLFEYDPAQENKKENGVVTFVLMMEVDMRHTADTLAASLDTEALRQLSGEQIASALVRIFSLEGSAKYHDMTPQDQREFPIDNRTQDQVLASDKNTESMEPTYFGLSPASYIHH